jgi:hypothetical protein
VSDSLSFPIRVPDLTHLKADELQALRHKLVLLIKDARRKSNAAMGRVPELKTPWMKMMAVKATAPNAEEVRIAFERELVRHPEAFVAYVHANSVALLDITIQREGLGRYVPPTSKKKAAAAPSLAPAAPTVPSPPPVMTVPPPASEPAPWEVEEE